MANDICGQVGERIRQIRKTRRWTQQMLADHAQLTREHVCRIEDGSAEMGLRTLARIAQALEVDPTTLLRD